MKGAQRERGAAGRAVTSCQQTLQPRFPGLWLILEHDNALIIDKRGGFQGRGRLRILKSMI